MTDPYPSFAKQHQDRWSEFALRDERWNRPLELFGIDPPTVRELLLGTGRLPTKAVFDDATRRIFREKVSFFQRHSAAINRMPENNREELCKPAWRLLGDMEKVIVQGAYDCAFAQLQRQAFASEDRVSALFWLAKLIGAELAEFFDEGKDQRSEEDSVCRIYDAWPLLFEGQVFGDLHKDWVQWLSSYPEEIFRPTIERSEWMTNLANAVWMANRQIGTPPAPPT